MPTNVADLNSSRVVCNSQVNPVCISNHTVEFVNGALTIWGSKFTLIAVGLHCRCALGVTLWQNWISFSGSRRHAWHA